MMRTSLFIANLALLFFIEPVYALDAQTLFAQQCSQCHGATLGGSAHGTALKGQSFKDTWATQNWQALARLSSTTMPPGEQDSLSTAEHAAVAKFIFTSNGLPVDAETQQDESQEATGSDSWDGASGVAEIARSRSYFKNNVVKGFKPVAQAELNNPSADDWLSWRRTLDGQAESPLKQVNKGNVKNLGLAWALAMQEGSAQITPIVRGGVMFLVQPGLVVQALKADTGDLIWQYKYPFPAASKTLGGPMRNFALFKDSLYISTYDAALIALDATTGTLKWRAVKADYREGYTHSAGPIIGNGIVLSGINGCERYKSDGCFITGHDADTGKELWRTSTIAAAAAGTKGDTWGGLPKEFRAGGDTWIAGSYDVALDLFFIGTSQAKPWVAASRGMDVENAALYTNSTLAIRPKTGEIVW
jgi:alcohol dehydrogenase (cytochrome c)